MISKGIIIWFPGPNNICYTSGEDMVEFHSQIHKKINNINTNSFLMKVVTQEKIGVIQNSISEIEGCRIAEPGEFTKIAFQNNKINLLKAESIADLISSETEIQRRQAVKIMTGKSAERFNSWRDGLVKVLANVEAKIDFPDEDLPEDILKNIKTKVNEIKNEIKKTLNDQKVGERIREGFKIAIVGPPNAGKSSLLNYLSNKEAAIVSEIVEQQEMS